jgi:glycosyltransferase involved in cell wall biosynthesis
MAGIGGTEIATEMQARLLSRAGWRVTIFGEPGPLTQSLDASVIEFICARLYACNIFITLFTLRNLVFVLRRLQPDVLHCQVARPVPLSWLAIWLSGRIGKTKLFWTSRGLEGNSYRFVVPLLDILGVRALGNCITEERKLLRYGMNAARTSYIYNGYRFKPTDRRLGRPPEIPLVIGTLAALRENRRVDHFIEMAVKLKSSLDPSCRVEFRVAGEGPARAALQAQADSLGISPHIRFLGNVSNVPSFLGGLHVMVSTIYSVHPEMGAGLSNSIIESMVIGVPVVAYDTAGIHEIVRDGQTGRLVRPGNVEELTKAVWDLLREPAYAETLSDAAHANILKVCDPTAILERLLRLYREL